jgi:hypothetical protein
MDRRTPTRRTLVAVLVAATVSVPAATASYGLALNASAPALRVDAKGNAEVSWKTAGARKSFVVPRTGVGHYGTLASADVSKKASLSVPLAVTTRRTPDGTLWALQRLAISGRPTSLDLARWRGAPTRLSLAATPKRLTGSVTFHGRPVTGSSPTLTGKRVHVYVYVECYGCPAARHGWTFLLGVPPKRNGTFALALRPTWKGTRYRASVQGPNVGGELAPDARVVVPAG